MSSILHCNCIFCESSHCTWECNQKCNLCPFFHQSNCVSLSQCHCDYCYIGCDSNVTLPANTISERDSIAIKKRSSGQRTRKQMAGNLVWIKTLQKVHQKTNCNKSQTLRFFSTANQRLISALLLTITSIITKHLTYINIHMSQCWYIVNGIRKLKLLEYEAHCVTCAHYLGNMVLNIQLPPPPPTAWVYIQTSLVICHSSFIPTRPLWADMDPAISRMTNTTVVIA